MNQIDKLTKYIINAINGERPEIDDEYPYITVTTGIWSPNVGDLCTIEARFNLAFCGELHGAYVFRSIV